VAGLHHDAHAAPAHNLLNRSKLELVALEGAGAGATGRSVR
jgi:hypothetical protein